MWWDMRVEHTGLGQSAEGVNVRAEAWGLHSKIYVKGNSN